MTTQNENAHVSATTQAKPDIGQNPDPSATNNSDDEELADCPKDEEAAHALYKQCLDIRNFEISNLASRNNFFMIFQGVLIAGVLQSSGSAPPVVMFLATLCGFGISVCQTMTSSGAKFWQNHWERELTKTEKNYGAVIKEASPKKRFYHLFKERKSADSNQTGKAGNPTPSETRGVAERILIQRFSVSKSPVYAALIFSVFWLILLLCTLTYPRAFIGEVITSSISGFPVGPTKNDVEKGKSPERQQILAPPK